MPFLPTFKHVFTYDWINGRKLYFHFNKQYYNINGHTSIFKSKMHFGIHQNALLYSNPIWRLNLLHHRHLHNLCIVYLYMLLCLPLQSHLHQSVLIGCTALGDVFFFKFLLPYCQFQVWKHQSTKQKSSNPPQKNARNMRHTHTLC